MASGRAHSLFSQTALVLAAAFVALTLIVQALAAWFVLAPLARRAADDLAALMVISAQTWSELPPATRPDFEQELARSHALLLEPTGAAAAVAARDPYAGLLAEALTARAGRPARVTLDAEPDWYWAEIPLADRTVRVGFAAERLGVRPPLALLAALGALGLAVLLTTLVLVRRVTRPLENLARAARGIGSGLPAQPVPEAGPAEIAALAAILNRSAQQVQELLDGRTVLLAGVSHDLRSPLTRMALAVEMLEDADPALLERLRGDIARMDGLIAQFLTLARGLEREPPQPVDLAALLAELAHEAGRAGAAVRVEAQACTVDAGPGALRRVLSNLLDNAVRYGAGQPVTLACGRHGDVLRIAVLDRGPGIPEREREAVFRPFYRLEGSRSSATGGSGLGLAIAKQLADANGWRLELLAREGGGTEARLTLPKAGAGGGIAAEAAPAPAGSSGL